jgi:hypothetical protein
VQYKSNYGRFSLLLFFFSFYFVVKVHDPLSLKKKKKCGCLQKSSQKETVMEEEEKRIRAAVVKTLDAVRTKITSYVPEPTPISEHMESPLMSVPVPTPMS